MLEAEIVAKLTDHQQAIEILTEGLGKALAEIGVLANTVVRMAGTVHPEVRTPLALSILEMIDDMQPEDQARADRVIRFLNPLLREA